MLTFNLNAQNDEVAKCLDSLELIANDLEIKLKPIQDRLISVNEQIRKLTLQKENTDLLNSESKGVLNITKGNLTFYKENDFSSSKQTIPIDSEILIFEKVGLFSKVEYDGVIGYISRIGNLF